MLEQTIYMRYILRHYNIIGTFLSLRHDLGPWNTKGAGVPLGYYGSVLKQMKLICRIKT